VPLFREKGPDPTEPQARLSYGEGSQRRNQDKGSILPPILRRNGTDSYRPFQLAAPKSKYVEAILSATNGGEAGVAEVFRTLQIRLRDSTWTIVFKSLIIVHLMIREGQTDMTLRYIAESPKRLAISNFTDGACIPG
jgi:ANTH domain